ncbi:hypothetical protein LTR95_009012 [Oleoguttula sp. CCFEE 5521]
MKLCIDRNLLLPILKSDHEQHIKDRMLESAGQYFVSIRSINHALNGGRENALVKTVECELTERGKAYVASREGALTFLERFRATPMELRGRIRERLKPVRNRRDV